MHFLIPHAISHANAFANYVAASVVVPMRRTLITADEIRQHARHYQFAIASWRDWKRTDNELTKRLESGAQLTPEAQIEYAKLRESLSQIITETYTEHVASESRKKVS